LSIAQEEYRRRPNVFAADALAWAYYKNGRYAEAKRAIAKALIQHTPDAGFLFHAGMIHAKLGDRVTPQRYLAQPLALNPALTHRAPRPHALSFATTRQTLPVESSSMYSPVFDPFWLT